MNRVYTTPVSLTTGKGTSGAARAPPSPAAGATGNGARALGAGTEPAPLPGSSARSAPGGAAPSCVRGPRLRPPKERRRAHHVSGGPSAAILAKPSGQQLRGSSSQRRASPPQGTGQSAPGAWVRCSEPANRDTGWSTASECGRHFVAGGVDVQCVFTGVVWPGGGGLGRHIPPRVFQRWGPKQRVGIPGGSSRSGCAEVGGQPVTEGLEAREVRCP